MGSASRFVKLGVAYRFLGGIGKPTTNLQLHFAAYRELQLRITRSIWPSMR